MAESAFKDNIWQSTQIKPVVTKRLRARLAASRARSIELARPLTAEDMVVQPSDDASPTKWHLAHTTWFFETFVLRDHLPGYDVFNPHFSHCFNSYYVRAGDRHPRSRRGLLTRPSLSEVLAYRSYVDAKLEELLAHPEGLTPDVEALIEIGINHEQQHQELLLTDILWVFAENPLFPQYRPTANNSSDAVPSVIPPINWIHFDRGIYSVGHEGDDFAWDNERPQHEVLLQPYCMSDRLITNGEWADFIEDGGYRNPLLWLSIGWASVEHENWQAPLRWLRDGSSWLQMTLHGLQPVNSSAPVTHISYFEADAYARWAGSRLPTEFEWESAVRLAGVTPPHSATREDLTPRPLQETSDGRIRQAFGEVWQWTASAYLPYPGYRVPEGTIGEYNGKFMVSQHVLKGSACITPAGHARISYRNFLYPHQRWQFSGVRLAREVNT